MTGILFIVFITFIASCNSKTTGKEVKIETVKKDTIAKKSTLNVVDQNKDLSVIYDTLVFTDNMNGEALNDKLATSQSELKFYKKFINPKKIDQVIVLNDTDTKSEINYLGKIRDLDNKASYHVVTKFKTIVTMLSPRGRSEVAFVNQANNKIIVYNLPMPQNLPKYIKNNILFFEFDNSRIGISILGGLPPLFCLPKIGCN
jgi:hypothetical protein